MSIITKAELDEIARLERVVGWDDIKRVVVRGDVVALLGDVYATDYNKGYEAARRNNSLAAYHRYRDAGKNEAFMHGFLTYGSQSIKWNDDYTRSGLIAWYVRLEVNQEHAAKQAQAGQVKACAVCSGPLDPTSEGGYVHLNDADDTHAPVEPVDRARLVQRNGITRVYATAADAASDNQAAVLGAYSNGAGFYRTYNVDGSSLGVYAHEAAAYAAIVRNDGWYPLKNCIRHADGGIYHTALEAADVLRETFKASTSVAFAMVTCASLGTSEARRPGQFQVEVAGERSDGATLYLVRDLRIAH